MEPHQLSLLSGLVGVLIGAGVSVVTTWIQSKSQEKRDLTKLAIELALQDQKLRMENLGPGGQILSATVFIHYHLGVVNLASKGKLTTVSLNKLGKENAELFNSVEHLQKAVVSRRDV